MNVSKYIHDYLMECKPSVIVPDLGCFTVVEKPSEIRGDGTVVPPVKTVQFDSENSNDDRLFVLFISNKENIPLDQASSEVWKFYHQNFMKKLLNTQSVAFEEFGSFSLNETGNIEFKPDANFFKNNYGLNNAYIPGKAVAPEPVI